MKTNLNRVLCSVMLLCFVSCNDYREQFIETEKFLPDFKVFNELVYTLNKDYKKSSDEIPDGYSTLAFYNKDSLVYNKKLYEKSKILIDNNQLESVMVYSPKLIEYQITTESKEPLSGIGLNYLVYSLFYINIEKTNEEELISLIIKASEEKITWIKKLDNNWYYVISEHYSD